jgi:hypothetical protein
VNTLRVDGQFDHLYQTQIRGEFLVFLLTNSSLQLTKEQFNALWDTLVKRALSTEESDACFTWLTQGPRAPAYAVMPCCVVMFCLNVAFCLLFRWMPVCSEFRRV